jgi:hypothetical protein
MIYRHQQRGIFCPNPNTEKSYVSGMLEVIVESEVTENKAGDIVLILILDGLALGWFLVI